MDTATDLFGDPLPPPKPPKRGAKRPPVATPQLEPSMRVVSYGGGVQSTALMVLAAQGRIPHRTFLFSNVGDDSEHPATLVFVREYAVPYAEAHGLELVTLERRRRDGTAETLHGRLTKEGSRSVPIPVRMSNGGAPGTRSCTLDFKIRVIAKELKRRGATPERPAEVAIGFSVDELERAKGYDPRRPYEHPAYPLLELGLTRTACKELIDAAGLPVPPKSSCYFCPFHSLAAWQRQAEEEPELHERSCELEELLNERRDTLGKDPVWLTRYGIPLRDVVGGRLAQGQLELEGPDGCDSGYCMT